MPRRSVVATDFYPEAHTLRAEFERRVDPHHITEDSFCWNYWHINEQYTYLRASAARIFQPESHRAFVRHLTQWGFEHLGCRKINTAWISYYVEGCRQQLHADVDHGPWAYVYSLTRWDERPFEGGETLLMRDEVLDYWQSGSILRGGDRGAVRDKLIEAIPSHFNQLVLFDGRIPHGVAEVRGTRDPAKGRVVVHGWFERPGLAVEGALEPARAAEVVRAGLAKLQQKLAEAEESDGMRVLRLEVAEDGAVSSLKVLTDTLESFERQRGARESLCAEIDGVLSGLRFPPADGTSRLTVPVISARDVGGR